jgi:RNA polymerase sigma factor (sigma-70 family)
MRAYEKYDPNRPTKFSTLAMHWVRKMVRQAYIHQHPVVLPFNVYFERQRKNQLCNKLYAKTGEKVASEPTGFNFNDQFDTLTEPENQLIYACINKKLDQLEKVCQECLSETECAVLRMRALGYKIDEIGEEFGFSKQRASQLFGRALTKIQENLKVDLPFPS